MKLTILTVFGVCCLLLTTTTVVNAQSGGIPSYPNNNGKITAPNRFTVSLGCLKRKLMKFDKKLGVIPYNGTKKISVGNNSAYVYWGCVGSVPITMTATFEMTEKDLARNFNYDYTLQHPKNFVANLSRIVYKDLSLALKWSVRAKKYTVLGKNFNSSYPINALCVTGSSNVKVAELTNYTVGKRYNPAFPLSLSQRRKNNVTNMIRLRLNFSCTLDFSKHRAGYYVYDLHLKTQGGGFAVTSQKQPIILNVPQPTVTAVKGCSGVENYMYTSGCSGRGTTKLTIYGWGFAPQPVHNQLFFTPLDTPARASPACYITSVVQQPTYISLKKNYTTIYMAGTGARISNTDVSVDMPIQIITCVFYQYGPPSKEVRTAAQRPQGKYMAVVKVDNYRYSRTGGIVARSNGRVDNRPYIEVSTINVPASTTGIGKNITMTPHQLLYCDKYTKTNSSVCQTGRDLSWSATFQPGDYGYKTITTGIRRVRAQFMATFRGQRLPSCGNYRYTINQNISRYCRTPVYLNFDIHNPTCVLNVTIRCTLNLDNVGAGYQNFRFRMFGGLFQDRNVRGFDVVKFYINKPTVTLMSVSKNNGTIAFYGFGFSKLKTKNVVVFTPRHGASTVTPVCPVYKVSVPHSYNRPEYTVQKEPGLIIYCRLQDFPVANVPVFGSFDVSIVTEGRRSNSTLYTITPFAITDVQGCNQYKYISLGATQPSLQCANPEILTFRGTGIRPSELTIQINPPVADCLYLNQQQFKYSAASLNLTQVTPIPTDTSFSCLFVTKVSNVAFTITLTQRGQNSIPARLTVFAPNVRLMRGCNRNITGARTVCPGALTTTVSVLVEYPSPVMNLNQISFGAASGNGVVPYCLENTKNTTHTAYRNYYSIDLRRILKNDTATQAQIIKYFGAGQRFTQNLRLVYQARPRSDSSYTGVSVKDKTRYPFYNVKRGPYWFDCHMSTLSSTCPATKVASGDVPVYFRRIPAEDQISTGSISVPKPSILKFDASSICDQQLPASNAKYTNQFPQYSQWNKCTMPAARSFLLTITGENFDECFLTGTPRRTLDSCGNDVTKFLLCTPVITAVDAAAKAIDTPISRLFNVSIVSTALIKTFPMPANNRYTVVLRLGLRNHRRPITEVFGTFKVEMVVRGQDAVSTFVNKPYTFSFPVPQAIEIRTNVTSSSQCTSLSNRELECLGGDVWVNIFVDGAITSPTVVVSKNHGSDAPVCKSVLFYRAPNNATRAKTQASPFNYVACLLSFANVTYPIGSYSLRIAQAPGPSFTVNFIQPVVYSITGCEGGCPFPGTVVTMTGKGLTSAALTFKAISAYPSSSYVPTCTQLTRTYTKYVCQLRMESSLNPIFGSWYVEVFPTRISGFHGKFKKSVSSSYRLVGPTITSRGPRVVSVMSAGCKAGATATSDQECNVAPTAQRFTIVGSGFTRAAAPNVITLSGSLGDVPCTIVGNLTQCKPHLHGAAACAAIGNINNTVAAQNRRYTYLPFFGEVLYCTATIAENAGRYQVKVSTQGIASADSFHFMFKVPVTTSPPMTVKVGESASCAGSVDCNCDAFIATMLNDLFTRLRTRSVAVKKLGCERGSVSVAFSVTAQASTSSLVNSVANVLSDPSSTVNQAFTVLSGLSVGSSIKFDRAVGFRNYYACNTKDKKNALSIRKFLSSCAVRRYPQPSGVAQEVVCTGDVTKSGCYNDPSGTKLFLKSASSGASLCQQATDRTGCHQVRENGVAICSWIPSLWRCVARDEYDTAYTS